MPAPERLPCTCTALRQPCAGCLAYYHRPLEMPLAWRGQPRKVVVQPAELRLRGLAHHYESGAATALFVPLAVLEVAWL